jgi:hypothetical protein
MDKCNLTSSNIPKNLSSSHAAHLAHNFQLHQQTPFSPNIQFSLSKKQRRAKEREEA